ncbi:immunoglobulin domain-containing protein, partial [Salmonella sp. s51228]|uniref:immunoglobulin domain-containing protein n=1 Tax=Salmonella sp. s51228 TaxID=3159652 RepID=UPI00397EF486
TTDQSIFDTTFSATASNQYGNDRREFTLRAAPQLDTGSGSVEVTSGTSDLLKIGTSVNAQPGTTVRLNAVDIFGEPTGTITWRRGTVTLPETGNILTISNVDESDYGSYTATATNQWGSSSATSVISQGNVVPKFPESSLVVT